MATVERQNVSKSTWDLGSLLATPLTSTPG